jgi:transposase-like protein
VDWTNFVRELFKDYVSRHMIHMKLRGKVEIDESLFGRRRKYNRGRVVSKSSVWVLGLIEVDTNTLILYPVESRDADTLEHIITRHVEVGSTIFTDSWAGYK